jgi:hypothetical protein
MFIFQNESFFRCINRFTPPRMALSTLEGFWEKKVWHNTLALDRNREFRVFRLRRPFQLSTSSVSDFPDGWHETCSRF